MSMSTLTSAPTPTSTSVSVIGLGFVGGAVLESFRLLNCNVVGYDKYKDGFSSQTIFEKCAETQIAFLCLPTVFDNALCEYDKSCIRDVCDRLEEFEYTGLVVIKSTVEPSTTAELADNYPSLKFAHNPEFLTASTAFTDFHNQTHIVLGAGPTTTSRDIDVVAEFYHHYYPRAEISRCDSHDSESMKIYVNCFYAAKIQFFNELYALTEKTGGNYEVVRMLMLKNNWINPMHTICPGTDGQLSYGGGCFPKDTNALLSHMKNAGTISGVLSAVITERNSMRDDHCNVNGAHVSISSEDEQEQSSCLFSQPNNLA